MREEDALMPGVDESQMQCASGTARRDVKTGGGGQRRGCRRLGGCSLVGGVAGVDGMRGL